MGRMQSPQSLTGQLQLYFNGEREGGDSIVREIMPRLREVAARKLGRQGNRITPSELIGETWLTRIHQGRWKIDDREHFFAIAGLAMEHVLTDMARRRLAARRGSGAVHVPLDEVSPCHQPIAANAEQVVAIGILMAQLAEVDEMCAAIVRAHYFVGFSLEEIAERTGLSLRQVCHRWEKGKLWLATRLAPSPSENRKTALGADKRSRISGIAKAVTSLGRRVGPNSIAAASVSINSVPRP
jgi:RNA polymerase sigma factor (TIGR02999 family)